MVKNANELLFIYGFIKDKELAGKTPEEREKLLEDAGEDTKKELLGKVHEETLETADGNFSKTGYPESFTNLRLIYEAYNANLEETYFWILEHLKQDRGFDDIIKILDLHVSSETSALWGNQQQRIQAQQNQAQSLLANIGKFVREIFQMVRELRIIDEKLDAYHTWGPHKDKDGNDVKPSDSADVTLKSIFTDIVEQGTKNPQSVFGLAQTVGFTILPDLFFNTRIYSTKQLDKKIDEMDYNTSIKNVLRRKLYQFIIWKEKTQKELENRKKFNVGYLKQHWKIIEMYMNWIKPYLRNVRALRMREDKEDDPDLVTSFDTNLSEVEILVKQRGDKKVFPVIIVNFQFRTRPEMNVRREYQQGPSHSGKMSITFRSYGWTEKQINNYRKMRAREDVELLGMLDKHLEDIMESLSDDFNAYILEQEKELDDGKKKPEKKTLKQEVKDASLAIEPFLAVFGGFADIFKLLVPLPQKKSKKGSSGPSSGDVKGAQKAAAINAQITWHVYKKATKKLTW